MKDETATPHAAVFPGPPATLRRLAAARDFDALAERSLLFGHRPAAAPPAEGDAD